MAYFLVKTEPGAYSFDELVGEGETVWDGVTNDLALKNMRGMKTGDLCFIYHSGSEKAVVGIARVTRTLVDAGKPGSVKAPVVYIEAVKRLATPVSLSELKKVKGLRDFDLIRLPRLSVMQVPEEVWSLILKLSEER